MSNRTLLLCRPEPRRTPNTKMLLQFPEHGNLLWFALARPAALPLDGACCGFRAETNAKEHSRTGSTTRQRFSECSFHSGVGLSHPLRVPQRKRRKEIRHATQALDERPDSKWPGNRFIRANTARAMEDQGDDRLCLVEPPTPTSSVAAEPAPTPVPIPEPAPEPARSNTGHPSQSPTWVKRS